MKLDKYYHLYGRKDDVVFEEVPNPEPHWIPVTEWLPGYGEDVLLTVGNYCVVGYLVATNDVENDEWYFSGWYHTMSEVTAWMPMPPVYKENGNED